MGCCGSSRSGGIEVMRMRLIVCGGSISWLVVCGGNLSILVVCGGNLSILVVCGGCISNCGMVVGGGCLRR